MTGTAAVSTLCPYCGHDLKTLPSRQKKCPACKRTIHYKKPFPYTMADTTIPKVLMTDEQAAQVESEWATRPTRMPGPDQPGPDGRMADGQLASTFFYERNLQGWRNSSCDIVAIEIVESPARRCNHQVRRLWLLDDPPPMPPPDCPYEPCLCWVAPVFADELNQREVFGWTLFDSDGNFTPVQIAITQTPKREPRPETPEDKIVKEAILRAFKFTTSVRKT